MNWLALGPFLVLTMGCGAEAPRPMPVVATAGPPKYPAFVVPLSRDSAYFQRAPAPDYWALAPYYVGQRDDVSCSLASLTMLVNAARRWTPLDAAQPLIGQTLLFERVSSPVWRRGLSPNGAGVTLDELATLATQSLRAFEIEPATISTFHVANASPVELERFRVALGASEASADDWLVLNFLVRTVLGSGDYGHIAPVGAYDAAQRRVLLLDPDREWLEPYWVPDEVALAGMATPDSVTGRPRGYLYVATSSHRVQR